MFDDENFFHYYSIEELTRLEKSFEYKFYSNEVLFNIRRIVKYFKFINDIKFSYCGKNYKDKIIVNNNYIDDEDRKNIRILIDLGFDSIYNLFNLIHIIDDIEKKCENNNIDKLYDIFIQYALHTQDINYTNNPELDLDYTYNTGTENSSNIFVYVRNISNIENLFNIFALELKKRFERDNKIDEYHSFINTASEVVRFRTYIVNKQIEYANNMRELMNNKDFSLPFLPFEEKHWNSSSEDDE